MLNFSASDEFNVEGSLRWPEEHGVPCHDDIGLLPCEIGSFSVTRLFFNN